MSSPDLERISSFKEYVIVWKRDAERQEALVAIVAQLLDQECRKNDLQHRNGYPSRVTVFHGSRAPTLSTRQYVERIAAFSGCSPCCLIIGAKYLEDLAQHDSAFLIDSYNGHRLILTSIMIAAKFLDDFYYSNGYWAKVGGIPVSELNGLETEFLFLMKFNLHIKRSAYDEYLVNLLKRSSQYYTEAVESSGANSRPVDSSVPVHAAPVPGPTFHRTMSEGGGTNGSSSQAAGYGYGMRQDSQQPHQSSSFSGLLPC